jgi:glycosyltransferase involved in cell wall biosynthesis
VSAGAPRVALCHEWLADRKGSEKTFELMSRVLPEADLYALTVDPLAPFDFGGRRPVTTFLDRVPVLRDNRSLQLPLMPLAWRYASRERYDLVVTSSHACVKGFGPGRRAIHLCYCYTPMRYAWLPMLDRRSPWERLLAAPLAVARAWDRGSVRWVDEFAAISVAVQRRIERFYNRSAVVIHPPVDTAFYTPGPAGGRRDFALVAGRMVPYKRVDLAIRACHALRYPLTVAGSGPELSNLRALADELGAEVTFELSPDDERLRALYRTARVLLFPGVEDFGIVPVEAQACGTPVVAVAEGGSVDTVVPGDTGVLVDGQDEKSFQPGIEEVLREPADPAACRRQAERFSTDRFADRFGRWVRAAVANW